MDPEQPQIKCPDHPPPAVQTPESLIIDECCRLLLESIREYAIFCLDANGKVITWSAGAEAIKGYTADEIVGRHFSVFYPPEAIAIHWPEQELAAASAQGWFEDHGWRLRRDGSRFWANVVIHPLRKSDGTLIGFAKITRDLTERMRHEESLRQSQERYRLVVDAIADHAVVSLNGEGQVASWNAGAERMFGYRTAEIVGTDSAHFYRDQDVAAAMPSHDLRDAAAGRFQRDGWRVRKDGSQFWAQMVMTPLVDDQDRLIGFAQITRDLTEARRLQVLEEAGHRNDEFLAMLAHELRNPLAPIRNALAVVRNQDLTDPVMQHCLDTIDRQAAHLSRLVDDLVDVSRVTSGKINLQRHPVDLKTVIARAVEAAEPFLEARSHRLQLDLSPESVQLAGDFARLAQVLVNLLDNAAKFTPDGGQINIGLRRESQFAVLSVKDNGIGMTREMRERAFDLFAQGERGLDRAEGGLGIGLSLVRRIVDLHEGTIEAVSAGPETGSEFIVRLPLTTRRALTTERGTPSHVAEGQEPLRILVVDDNVDSAETMSMLLRIWGHAVCVAHNGTEALRLARKHAPHMVLLDIGLPGMDGFEVARRLRKIGKARRAVLLAVTGYSQPDDRLHALAAGFDDYLVKPVDAGELRQLVARAQQSVHRHECEARRHTYPPIHTVASMASWQPDSPVRSAR
ncbi:MAG: PAS domain S-box protein [Burkholderiales bacterium]|nr:PAS domain S-box protein [Burkholderiales bacterium]